MEIALFMFFGGLILFCLLTYEVMFGGGATGIERVERSSASFSNGNHHLTGSTEEGLFFINQGRYPEAISVFEKILLDDPNNSRACWNLAVSYDRNSDKKNAIKYH